MAYLRKHLALLVCSLCLLVSGTARADDPAAIVETVDPPQWSSQGVYSALGLAPATTFYAQGFAPSLRYDFELGMHWTRGRTAVFVGADARIVQVFGRKAPGGGVDAMLTLAAGPVYGRVGAGVMTGIPRSMDLHDAMPSLGGTVGLGLQGRKGDLVGRVGVDYDVRVDPFGHVNQTVFLTLRFVFGFSR